MILDTGPLKRIRLTDNPLAANDGRHIEVQSEGKVFRCFSFAADLDLWSSVEDVKAVDSCLVVETYGPVRLCDVVEETRAARAF